MAADEPSIGARTVRVRRQRGLYLAEHRALGVGRLDGERPADELSAHIAWRVWHALGPPGGG